MILPLKNSSGSAPSLISRMSKLISNVNPNSSSRLSLILSAANNAFYKKRKYQPKIL